mmetsp:Transcript_25538/g.51093  ORF Transcript_25538/g.51093 Transcript_25538/m.51093 type:complete len:313 (-) Transcript_25538:188-1126(-)|eukprot:CAMPEP_0196717722 /NCGR_PEP_ID=MMETSP1091-20130531/1090_1 /TAXON_ID=302021 /ORGANISM="Rhodomonas sp., Strain CCMP768" /LENGTH=312 /DNA_ID=CAMNT_0042058191 /DNA_START=26 /DNA_END=964 /DNA_ORIENTATION=-
MDVSKVYDRKDYDQYLVAVVFDLLQQDVAGLEASFKVSVRESICNALDLAPSCVIPEELHDGAGAASNVTLDLVLFGPNIKAYITKLYEQISNPGSFLRQGKYTRKAITAEVSKVCQKEECLEAKRLIPERDAYEKQALLAKEEFIRQHQQAEEMRQVAIDAEKLVAGLYMEQQRMESDFNELRRIDETAAKAAEEDLKNFKINLRKNVQTATESANLARTLMEEVARSRQDAELKNVACDEVSRRWSRAAFRALETCGECKWAQDMKRYEEGLYKYRQPDGAFTGSFFEVTSSFARLRQAQGPSLIPPAGS